MKRKPVKPGRSEKTQVRRGKLPPAVPAPKPPARPVSLAPMDTSHVPPADPANFWPFTPGQTRTIAAERPLLAFRVDKIHADRIEGTVIVNAEVVHGELLLNVPVVIAKTPADEPLVTLTLREVRDGNAFLQVTAHPGLKVMPRQ